MKWLRVLWVVVLFSMIVLDMVGEVLSVVVKVVVVVGEGVG